VYLPSSPVPFVVFRAPTEPRRPRLSPVGQSCFPSSLFPFVAFRHHRVRAEAVARVACSSDTGCGDFLETGDFWIVPLLIYPRTPNHALKRVLVHPLPCACNNQSYSNNLLFGMLAFGNSRIIAFIWFLGLRKNAFENTGSGNIQWSLLIYKEINGTVSPQAAQIKFNAEWEKLKAEATDKDDLYKKACARLQQYREKKTQNKTATLHRFFQVRYFTTLPFSREIYKMNFLAVFFFLSLNSLSSCFWPISF